MIGLVKLGKGMLFSVEQAFVGRDKIQAPLQMPAVTHACIIAYPTSQYPKGYNCHYFVAFLCQIKKRQQHISSMLQAQNIPFETVDVASDPSALDRMRELVTKGKPKIKDPDDEEEDEEEEEEVILAPQIANGDEYCGVRNLHHLSRIECQFDITGEINTLWISPLPHGVGLSLEYFPNAGWSDESQPPKIFFFGTQN